MRTAREFNHRMELLTTPPEAVPRASSLFSSISLTGSPALVLDGIKRGEDDEDISRGFLPTREGRSIILRIYESLGGKARGTIELGDILKVKKVWRTNALEDDEDECTVQNGKIKIELRAFEVATYRLQL